jgi:hypothetical protein
LYRGKCNPKISATSVILILLLKVNNHPLGENSPNLVTLLALSLYLEVCVAVAVFPVRFVGRQVAPDVQDGLESI